MPIANVYSELEQWLRELKEKHGESVKAEDVSKAVENLIGSLKLDLTSVEQKLFSDLKSLSNEIQATKTEIAALRPSDIKHEYLPTATDELDAIVESTAEATNEIMDAAESIGNVLNSIEGQAGQDLMNATTKIYEACGFQDITGQRITKVVKALKDIEVKVDAMLAAFGTEIWSDTTSQTVKEEKNKPVTDEDLLNGPQFHAKAQTQEDIDKLLESFD